MNARLEFHKHLETCQQCTLAMYSWHFCEAGQRLWRLAELNLSVNVVLPVNAFEL